LKRVDVVPKVKHMDVVPKVKHRDVVPKVKQKNVFRSLNDTKHLNLSKETREAEETSVCVYIPVQLLNAKRT